MRPKILKIVCIVLILSINFIHHSAAQDGFVQRKKRLKAFSEKRQIQKGLQAASHQITTSLDVAYSKDLNPLKKLDIYFPGKKDGNVPVLIHFHGGGWKFGDKSRTKNHGIFYASHGILFISVNYRLSPAVKHPAHIEDCAAAVAWVFENIHDLGGDENRVFISGHSAGAQLAALLATNPTYLQKYNLDPKMFAGAILVDTASFDLMSPNNEKIVKRFIRQAFGTNLQILKSASPLFNISDEVIYPKFLIFASGNRKSSSMAQGKKLADALKKAGGKAQFIVVKNHSHRDMNLAMYDASDLVGSTILKFILHQKDQIIMIKATLQQYTPSILKIADRYGARKIRVFGSFADGNVDDNSDLDLLVDLEQGSDLLDLIGFKQELEVRISRRKAGQSFDIPRLKERADAGRYVAIGVFAPQGHFRVGTGEAKLANFQYNLSADQKNQIVTCSFSNTLKLCKPGSGYEKE